MSNLKPIWSDFKALSSKPVVLFATSILTVTLCANLSFALQTNGDQSSVLVSFSESGVDQSSRRSRPTETILTVSDQTNQESHVVKKTSFSDVNDESNHTFSDSPAPASGNPVRRSIGDIAQLPVRTNVNAHSGNQPHSILSDAKIPSFKSSTRRSRTTEIVKSGWQSTPSLSAIPAKAYGESIATPPVPQMIAVADNSAYSGTNSAKAVAAPRRVSEKKSQVSGTRLIESNLSSMKFVKAKQYLTQNPEFDDPKEYLSKPKTAKSKKPKSSSSKARSQSQARSRSRSRSRTTKKRATAQVSISDDAFLNPIADVSAPISPVPFGNIRRYDRKLLANDAVTMQSTSGDRHNYAQLTHNEHIPSSKAWEASNFAHNPLYFEETQLERYGNRRPLQAIYSGLHFFGTIPFLPYKVGADCPRDCIYTYDTYRPGDCVPYDIEHRPLDKKGLFNQALWTTAIAVPH